MFLQILSYTLSPDHSGIPVQRHPKQATSLRKQPSHSARLQTFYFPPWSIPDQIRNDPHVEEVEAPERHNVAGFRSEDWRSFGPPNGIISCWLAQSGKSDHKVPDKVRNQRRTGRKGERSSSRARTMVHVGRHGQGSRRSSLILARCAAAGEAIWVVHVSNSVQKVVALIIRNSARRSSREIDCTRYMIPVSVLRHHRDGISPVAERPRENDGVAWTSASDGPQSLILRKV